MDKLPAAIEEKIHELLADDAKSIGSLLRLTRHHARDRRLWRKLLTTSCPGYEPSDDTSIDDLKAFVLSFDEKPYGWWKQGRRFGGASDTYRLTIKAGDRREWAEVNLTVNGISVGQIGALVGSERPQSTGGLCVIRDIEHMDIRMTRTAYKQLLKTSTLWLEGPFQSGNLVKVEPTWVEYQYSYQGGQLPNNTPGAAGTEDNGAPLWISTKDLFNSSQDVEVGKSGHHLTFHYAAGDCEEKIPHGQWQGTFVMTNINSFQWVRTRCGEDVASLARQRGAVIRKSNDTILYAARIKFRGWDGGCPKTSGRVVSVLPGKYVAGSAFPHFTWGGAATASVFAGEFELLCYYVA